MTDSPTPIHLKARDVALEELLKAAKALLPLFERGSFLVETEEADEAVTVLRAAISRAEAKSHD